MDLQSLFFLLKPALSHVREMNPPKAAHYEGEKLLDAIPMTDYQ